MTDQFFTKAQWIWRAEEAGRDEFCDFLDRVTVPAGEGRYYLTISSDSNYTVWLGGQLAAFGQYADYPHYKICDRVEITDLLSSGEVRLAATVWYYGIDSSTYRRGEAGLIYEITDEKGNVLAASGAHTLSRLSPEYVSGVGRLISPQLGPTYHADLRCRDGFQTGGGKGFSPSRVVTDISTEFHLRPNEKLILCNRLPASVCRTGAFAYTFAWDASLGTHAYNPAAAMQSACVTSRPQGFLPRLTGAADSPIVEISLAEHEKNCNGVYVIVDLGAETAGFPDFDIEVPAACCMDVGFGEHLIDGVCRTGVRGFSADVELAAGRNQYLHTFRRFGCRYVQLFIHAPSAKIRYAGIRPTLYPLHHKDFRCGNLLRETIYRTCQNTLQHCLHEHYEDCPWREQALYTLDSRNQMLCGYYAFGETRAPRAALELIAHGQRKDGLLMLCYPAGADAPIPAFSCMYFVQMEEYIRYTGDTSLAVTYYDLLESILATFGSRMTDEGVLENFYGPGPDGKVEYWNFYEWSKTMDGRFCETERRLESPLNAVYSLALGAMEKICAAIGKTERASELLARRDALNAAIARKFYNPETRMFETFEQRGGRYTALTQALCLLCGAARDVDTEVMLDALASNGGRVGELDVVPNTLSMNAFRFDALLAVDREKYAPVILDEIDRDYLYMLQNGATAFWETIHGAADFGGAGSLCHGWSALPVYYYEILLGKD